MSPFFQDFEKEEFEESIKACKMHDIVCDFVKFLTKDEYHVVDGLIGIDKKHSALNERTRHLTINIDARISYEDSLSPLKYNAKDKTKLRTLFSAACFSLEDQYSLFLHQTHIRTLIFRISTILKDISKLIHLRYLRVLIPSKVPNMICDLFNLQTLDLRGSSCDKLPENMGKLVNLR